MAKLQESCIDREVAKERGYWSATTKAQLDREGFSVAQRRPPALVIPLWDVTGQRAGGQVRPDNPRMLKGRPAKYETAAGQSMVLDVPPRVRPHLSNPGRPLVVTEGPIKADAIVSAGLDAVALLGVWSWRGTNVENGKVALAAWESVALNGRQLYICFDSDAMLNPHVHEAMARLGAFLTARKASVAYIYLPSGDAGAKVGADDYLAAGNTADQLLNLASPDLRRVDTGPPAPQQRPQAIRRSLADVDKTFRKWLQDVDLEALHAALGAVVANRAQGDPVWLLLVSAASSGKTEILSPLAQLPDVTMSGKLTAAALLSGTSKKERTADATGGLLPVIGKRGILVNKDFGSVLAMPRDPRAELLQALRDIYDGRYDRAVGVDGGRSLNWHGHCGLIAGCTPVIDKHHTVVAALGDRYVMLRVKPGDATAQARRALGANGREDEMRRELEDAVCGLLDHHETDLPPLSDTDIERLADLARLAVQCRSYVDRDSRTTDILEVPVPEMPARLAKQLGQLLRGVRALGSPRPWNIVTRCALDSMPNRRKMALVHLANHAVHQDTAALVRALSLPKSTVRRTLEDLEALGVVARTSRGQRGTDHWTLTNECRSIWPTAPEMSEPEASASDARPQHEVPLASSPTDDISGAVTTDAGKSADSTLVALMEAFHGATLVTGEGEPTEASMSAGHIGNPLSSPVVDGDDLQLTEDELERILANAPPLDVIPDHVLDHWAESDQANDDEAA